MALKLFYAFLLNATILINDIGSSFNIKTFRKTAYIARNQKYPKVRHVVRKFFLEKRLKYKGSDTLQRF